MNRGMDKWKGKDKKMDRIMERTSAISKKCKFKHN